MQRCRYRNRNINSKSIEIAEIEEGFIFYIQISSTSSPVEPRRSEESCGWTSCFLKLPAVVYTCLQTLNSLISSRCQTSRTTWI
jgi:hypothetical protein